jgi:hypothetical protein
MLAKLCASGLRLTASVDIGVTLGLRGVCLNDRFGGKMSDVHCVTPCTCWGAPLHAPRGSILAPE